MDPFGTSKREREAAGVPPSYALEATYSNTFPEQDGSLPRKAGRGRLPTRLHFVGMMFDRLNPTTTIAFSIPASSFASSKIYSSLGQEITELRIKKSLKLILSQRIHFKLSIVAHLSRLRVETLRCQSYSWSHFGVQARRRPSRHCREVPIINIEIAIAALPVTPFRNILARRIHAVSHENEK